MSPAGLSNRVVDALIKSSPSVLFLLFGRRAILSSATMWETILYPPIFIKVIDVAVSFLFGWKTRNISTSQKLAAYPHLYSFTSTKSVVHWFQIIRTKSFQMYDDDVQQPLSLSTSSRFTKVAKYPTRNIKTPIVLVYGGSDSLVDIKVMLRQLPPQTVATEIPRYEHIDFLWARDVDAQVFRHVFDALDSFTGAEHTKEEYNRYRTARSSSISASVNFRRHAHHDSVDTQADVTDETTATTTEAESDSGDRTLVNGRGGSRSILRHQATEGLRSPSRGSEVSVGPASGGLNTNGTVASDGESSSGSPARRRAGIQRHTSGVSVDSLRQGRGIRVGASRAVGGVTAAIAGGNSPSSGTD